MSEPCHFCEKPTEDFASVLVERGFRKWETPARFCEMSVYCCYDCFYKHLCDAVKKRIPEIVEEVRAKVAPKPKFAHQEEWVVTEEEAKQIADLMAAPPGSPGTWRGQVIPVVETNPDRLS